ncbi:MAG: MerR family transcriptional regulator [Nocardioides sp.]
MEPLDPLTESRALFAISVAADLVGTGVQNLRAYERRGLVEPQRTPGGTRLYAAADIDRLRRITELLGTGHNLAGVESVLALERENALLRAEIRQLREQAGDAPV